MVKKNTCIFISGKGSNLKNLILRSRDSNFPIKIKLIVSNNKCAKGILYAKMNAIPYLIINTNMKNFENNLKNSGIPKGLERDFKRGVKIIDASKVSTKSIKEAIANIAVTDETVFRSN